MQRRSLARLVLAQVRASMLSLPWFCSAFARTYSLCAARSDIDEDEWSKFKYYKNAAAVAAPAPCGRLAREHASTLTLDQFRERYERPNLPCVVTGVADDWPGNHGNWNPQALYEKYRHFGMKCGEDDDGNAVKMKLKYFFRYLMTQKDDSPLYVFHSSFEDDKHVSPPVACRCTTGGGVAWLWLLCVTAMLWR